MLCEYRRKKLVVAGTGAGAEGRGARLWSRWWLGWTLKIEKGTCRKSRRELPEKNMRAALTECSWVRTGNLVCLVKYMTCSQDKWGLIYIYKSIFSLFAIYKTLFTIYKSITYCTWKQQKQQKSLCTTIVYSCSENWIYLSLTTQRESMTLLSSCLLAPCTVLANLEVAQ